MKIENVFRQDCPKLSVWYIMIWRNLNQWKSCLAAILSSVAGCLIRRAHISIPNALMYSGIEPMKRLSVVSGRGRGGGFHHFALHLQYSCLDVPYICVMSFYLHTKLELCILFLTLQIIFYQCKTFNVCVWTKCLNVSAHNAGHYLWEIHWDRVVPTAEPDFDRF